MASEKLSVSVDAELWAAVRALSLPERSASALVAEALRRLIAGEQLRALLDELDAERRCGEKLAVALDPERAARRYASAVRDRHVIGYLDEDRTATVPGRRLR